MLRAIAHFPIIPHLDFNVTILGSNSAISDHGRHPTAQFIQLHHSYFLIDCGEGTQQRMLQYKVKWFAVNHIFISHLHGDHYFGLIGLLTTYNLLKRTQPLTIFGPPLLQQIIQLQLDASGTKLNYELTFAATSDDDFRLIFENEQTEVYSFPLKHKIPTTGFLVKEKPGERKLNKSKLSQYDIEKEDYKLLKQGIDITAKNGLSVKAADVTDAPHAPRKYAFCSDTIYNEDMLPYIADSDLIYHEATYLHESEERAQETRHSTALQAAQIAQKANVKRLIIGHFSSRYHQLSPLLEEAQLIFPNTELALEGTVFKL